MWFNPFDGTFLDQSRKNQNESQSMSRKNTSQGMRTKHKYFSNKLNESKRRPFSKYTRKSDFAIEKFNEPQVHAQYEEGDETRIHPADLPARYNDFSEYVEKPHSIVALNPVKSDERMEENRKYDLKNLLSHRNSETYDDLTLSKNKPTRYIYNLKTDEAEVNLNKLTKEILNEASAIKIHKKVLSWQYNNKMFINQKSSKNCQM